jgi:hypothetical protein
LIPIEIVVRKPIDKRTRFPKNQPQFSGEAEKTNNKTIKLNL